MRSILKALGLTIWGMVALGLIALFVFVGYEAAIRHHASSAAMVNEGASSDQPGPAAPSPMSQTADVSHTSDLASTREATRKLFLDAVHDSNYQSEITYGGELANENVAQPGDLVVVAQAYSSVGDCGNARLWAEKARDAFKAARVPSDSSQHRVILCCGRGPENYELAIAAIERGLAKGGIVHLDEAYIYLGRAKVAIGDIEGARNAFSKLKDVPGISPRVLRLWTLYAETQLTTSENRQCPKGASRP